MRRTGGASDATVRSIELEVKAVLSRALDLARKLLEDHRALLLSLQQALLERETLDRTELQALLKSCVATR